MTRGCAGGGGGGGLQLVCEMGEISAKFYADKSVLIPEPGPCSGSPGHDSLRAVHECRLEISKLFIHTEMEPF